MTESSGRTVEWNDTLVRLKAGDATLTSLDLAKLGLPPELIDQLADAFKSNKYLSTLKLARNKLRDAGVTSLSYALRQNNSLTALDLSFNDITAAGAILLADTLLVNRYLTILSLEGNAIGLEGGNRLAENLKSNKTLTWLNVNSCGLTGEQWKASLKFNTSLTRLDAADGNDAQFASGGFIDNMVKTSAILAGIASSFSQASDPLQLGQKLTTDFPTLLAESALRGHAAAVKKMLDWGVDPNSKNKSGQSALFEAIRGQELELVKLLVACGASTSDSLMQAAQESGQKDIIAAVKRMRNKVLDLSGGLHLMAVDSISEDNVSSLHLSNNNLTSLPGKLVTKILAMKDLTQLNLSNNALTSLPADIGKLTQLVQLNLADNQLDTLPAALGNLVNLKDFNVKHNPLTTIPEDVVKKAHTGRLIQYLKEIQAPTKAWNRLKLVVVGESNVGKTHLVRALQKKEYPRYSPTESIEIQSVPISKSVEFRVFDFGGQIVGYPTHTFFLSDRALYLIVFNCIDTRSRSRVEYWLKIIRATASVVACPVVIVGTHFDDPQCTPAIMQDIQDTFKKFKVMFNNIKAILYVNTPQGIGVKELRKKLIELASTQKVITSLVPQSYHVLDKVLATQKAEGKQVLKWTEYQLLAQKCNITDERSLVNATEFLYDVGSIIWFNQPLVRDLVMLDPQWLSNIMESIVSFKQNWRNGILLHESLPIIWKAYPESLHKTLLAILEKFEVVFPIKGQDGASIVPSLLPDQPSPIFKALSTRVLDPILYERFERTYRFDFLPVGFFSRLVVRLYHTPELFCHDPNQKGLVITPTRALELLNSSKNSTLAAEEAMVQRAVEDGFEQAVLQFYTEPHTSVLNVTVWRPYNPESVNRAADGERDNLLNPIIDTIEMLITGWFKRYDQNIKRFIIWTHAGKTVELEYEPAVRAILAGELEVDYKDYKLSLAKVAPDLSCAGVQIYKDIAYEKRLGEGGCAVIYLAKQNGVPMAMKELKLKPNAEFQKFREFVHEVFTMSALSHPNLVMLHGVQLAPKLCMCLEFVPGTDLAAVLHNPDISDAQFNWRVRTKLALDIARGMHYLQGLSPPIIHRDLRSPNIFVLTLNEEAEVCAKVADFGLASKVLTSLAEMLFTWQWLAPEVIDADGAQYDERADIYSFGMVLWEIASRAFPFSEFDQYISRTIENLTDAQMADQTFLAQLAAGGWELKGRQAIREEYQKQKFIDAIVKENLRPTIPPSTPEVFKKLIEACWAPNPALRPPFEDIVRQLSEFLGDRREQGAINRISQPKGSLASLKLFERPLEATPTSVAAPVNPGDLVVASNSSPRLGLVPSNSGTASPVPSAQGSPVLANPGGFVIGALPGRDQLTNIVTPSGENRSVSPSKKRLSAHLDTHSSPSILSRGTYVGRAGSSAAVSSASAPSGMTAEKKNKPVILTRRLEPDISKAALVLAQWQNQVWVGQQDGVISIFENSSPPKFVTSIVASKKEVYALAAVGDYVWSGASDATISIWDPKKFKLKKTLKGHGGIVKFILPIVKASSTIGSSIGGKSKQIVWTGDVQGWVHVWKGTSYQSKFLVESGQPVNAMTYNDATQQVWIGSFKKLYVHHASTCQQLLAVEAHGGLISCMAATDSLVWSCCSDLKTVSAWDATKLAVAIQFKDMPRLYGITIVESQGQKQLWAGALDNLIYIYNSQSGELLETLKGHTDYVYCLLKVKGDSVVWSGSRDCSIRQWSF